MKNKFKIKSIKEDTLTLILVIFICLQPFLDASIFFENSNLVFFGVTIPTLIRCLFTGILIVLTARKMMRDSNRKYYYVYLIAVLIYFVIHHIISTAPLTAPATFKYSMFTEMFYFVRLIIPLVIIYVTKSSNISFKKFLNSLLFVSLIIGSVILFSNILCISLTSYSTEKMFTVANFFTWGSSTSSLFDFASLTSKGWFYMANQLSGVMVLLLPFNLYCLLFKPKKLSVFSTLVLTLSMITVGTRVASFGWILIYVLMLAFYIVYNIIVGNKYEFRNVKYVVVMLPLLLLVMYRSPILNRNYHYDVIDKEDIPLIPEIVDEGDSDVELEKYVFENYEKFKIQDIYILELYPYKEDLDFWANIFEISKKEVLDNREMQTLITKRINERSDRMVMRSLFGSSFSRYINGGIYIEHDFYVQKFTIGFLGILLFFFPYIIILLYFLYYVMRNLNSPSTPIMFVILLSGFVVFGASLFSGHLIDELFLMIQMGFILGFGVKVVNSNVSIDI